MWRPGTYSITKYGWPSCVAHLAIDGCCWGVPPFQRVLGAVVMPLPGPHRDRFPIDDLVGLDEDGIRPERDVFDVVDDALVVACGASADATRTLHHPEDEFLVTPNGAKIALDI